MKKMIVDRYISEKWDGRQRMEKAPMVYYANGWHRTYPEVTVIT